MDPITLIALLGPLIKSGGQALINKFAKGDQFKPANVDDAIKMMEAETKQLEARIKVGDSEGPAYVWVTSLIKLQRPIIVYGTITGFMIMSLWGLGTDTDRKLISDMAQVVVFWLFGERTLMKIQDK